MIIIKRILALILLLSCVAMTGCLRKTTGAGDATETLVGTTDEAAQTDAVSGTDTEEKPHTTTICIDPGHGFDDVGCESEYLDTNERDINFAVAKILQSKLEALDYTVLLIHDGESFPSSTELMKLADAAGLEYDSEKIIDNNIFSAYERILYANVLDKQSTIDFYVSLHVNTVENAEYVNGITIDYSLENPYADELETITDQFSETLSERLDTSVEIFADEYDDAFIVTKYTNIPSILIEMGYATNQQDAENLQNEEWQQSFATAVTDVLHSKFG